MQKKRQFVFMNFLFSCIVSSFAFYKFCAEEATKKVDSLGVRMRVMGRWKCDEAFVDAAMKSYE